VRRNAEIGGCKKCNLYMAIMTYASKKPIVTFLPAALFFSSARKVVRNVTAGRGGEEGVGGD